MVSNPSLLILLIGSNPLPSLLAACALRAKKIALVHTEETRDAKNRLKAVLSGVLGRSACFVDPDPCVEDATCATAVQKVIERIAASAGAGSVGGAGLGLLLSYTGGTKVMAVHASMAFAKSGGVPGHASYVDDGGQRQEPRLRFDDGTSKALAEYTDMMPLSLEAILALHGIAYKERTARELAPTTDDAREILCKTLGDISLPERLYEERKRLAGLKKPREAGECPFVAADFGIELSLGKVHTQTMNPKLYKDWYRFIGGEWLEEWLGQQIRCLDLQPEPEVVVGVNSFRGSDKVNMEVDVAVVRGHRSYFISCTTDTTKSRCKSKLFEIAIRSRHLGGDLARAALVCLADDKVTSGLQADIEDLWGASNTPRVFGVSDIRSWSDCGGQPAHRYSLKTWLQS